MVFVVYLSTLAADLFDRIRRSAKAKSPAIRRRSQQKVEAALRHPQEIMEEIKAQDEESAEILNSILELI